MTFREQVMRARALAVKGEFVEARQLLYLLVPRCSVDEGELGRAWKRIEELQS
jgi:hypothetical protein